MGKRAFAGTKAYTEAISLQPFKQFFSFLSQLLNIKDQEIRNSILEMNTKKLVSVYSHLHS